MVRWLLSSTVLARASAAAALLAVLPVAPALAQSYGATGGAGGVSLGTITQGGNGGDAATSSPPAAATGGDAGTGNATLSLPGGDGGDAGTSGSPNGGVGMAAGGGGGGGGGGYSNTSLSPIINSDLIGGNGGGGGSGAGAGGGGAGGDGLISTATTDVSIASGVTIRGGNGGVGGSGAGDNAGAGGTGSGGAAGGATGFATDGDGGGGGGGAGIVVTTTGISLTNNGTVSGGNGGGDSDLSYKGSGGGGGAGVIATGITIVNNGAISGGAGGSSGNFINSSNPVGGGGDGAAGIIGRDLAIINAGTISGGAGDPSLGGANGNAITLTGGVNSLELRAGSVINGSVVGATGAGTSNTLILGGATGAAFDVSAIGGQYQNFTAFQKTGAGTWTLIGTNLAATPWTLSDGTLSISSDGALGASSGGLTFNGGTLNTTQNITMTRATALNAGGGTFDVDSGTTLTMGGEISGNGSLTKSGIGTLTLTNTNNAYSGGTTISAGTLSIASNNNLGTGALTFNGGTLNTTQNITMTRATALNAGGGTFDVDSGTTLTMNGVISGTGGLTKTDTGTLTLSAGNGYSGGTTISAGTLSISSNNNLGTGALTFNGGTLNTTQNIAMTRATALNGAGTFDVDSGTTLTMNGVISGTGSLTKTDTGTLTLSAGNAYSGGTTISAGTLRISANDNLGTGALTFDGGTLNTTQNIAMTRAVTLNGGGTFDIDSGTTLTLNGVISGGGGLTKTDTGTLTLTNASDSYTGPTMINVGMLSLSGAGSIAGSSVTVASGATFDISATTNGASIRSLSGAGDVVLGSRTLTLTHSPASFSNFAGEITGTGGLTLSGGVLFLDGANTYTGATTINGGALILRDNHGGSIADSSTVSVASGARFDIENTTNGGTIKSLSGAGEVRIGDQTLTLTDAGGTFSGAFTGTFGTPTGGLTLSSTNTGTQTLTGANNSIGAVNVGGGTLAFGQNGVFNAASYETQSGAATIIAATARLGVGGAFTQGGGSTLNIAVGASNTPTITANTASLGGTLNLSGISSAAQLDQVLISTANGITGDFGSVSIGGFAGTVDYFTVHTGKSADATKYLATYGLSWTANNNLAHGTFTLTNSANSFNVGVALGDETANPVTGWDGKSLTKAGDGTLILSAANTYTGGTTITGGVLQLGDGVNAGTILGNVSTSDPNDSTKSGTLAFSQPHATTFSGVISGTGSVIQNGAGTLTLTGVNTYTGATTVDAGMLAVNGSIAASSLLTVNAGGTLGGNGSVGNVIINGGTFAPGDGAAGTSMNVAGSLAFASGAVYLVQVNPTTSSFSTVTGAATLNGVTVSASFAPGSYVGRQYTIMTAGSISGTFNPTVANSGLPPGFSTTLSYDGTHAYLNLELNFAVPGTGLSGNQQNVGNALTNFFNNNGIIPIEFGSLTPAGLTQISGELGTAPQQTTFNAMNQFLGVLTDPFIAGRGDPVAAGGAPNAYVEASMAYAAGGKGRAKSERDAYAAVYTKAPVAPSFEQRWSVWAAGFGGSQQTDGSTAVGSNNTTSKLYGTAVGADYHFSPHTVAGFAIAGGGTNFALANNLGGGRSDLFQAGAFIRHGVGPAYLTGALAYGWQDIVTDRTVTAAGVDRLRAEFKANAWSGRLEGGYRFIAWGIGLTPYAAGQFTTFDLPGYAEQAIVGSNVFALAYDAKTVTDARSELGLRTDKSFAAADGITTLRGRLAWAHNFNPVRSIGATFQALPGASFVVNGAAQAADAVLVTASVEKKWLNGWSAAAAFEGEFSNVTRSYAGKGLVKYQW